MWTSRCLPFTTRAPSAQNKAYHTLCSCVSKQCETYRKDGYGLWCCGECRDSCPPALCSGGFCHACEGCDLHCNCADTDEPRHIAGMNLGELP